MQALKAVNNFKKSVINTVLLLLVGGGIGSGSTVWLVQQNLDGVCGLVNARNEFIKFVQKDSK